MNQVEKRLQGNLTIWKTMDTLKYLSLFGSSLFLTGVMLLLLNFIPGGSKCKLSHDVNFEFTAT